MDKIQDVIPITKAVPIIVNKLKIITRKRSEDRSQQTRKADPSFFLGLPASTLV